MRKLNSRSLIIHPFLIALFPVLFLYTQNIDELTLKEAVLPAFLLLGLTLLLLICVNLVFRNWFKAGLFVTLCVILFFSYGHVFDLIEGLPKIGYLLCRKRYMLLLYGTAFAVTFYLIFRTTKDLRKTTDVLNIIAATLVLISFARVALHSINSGHPDIENRINKNEKYSGHGKFPTDTPRDIYYIILDGYASSGTLLKFYAFDNHEFVDHLREAGFIVQDNFCSNYATTFMSLVSSLNMDYLNYLSDIVKNRSRDRRAVYHMIKDNKVKTILRSYGYKYIHFKSGWGPTDYNSYADVNIQCGKTNEFLMILIQTSMLKAFEDQIIGDDSRERILCTFSKLSEMPFVEGPKFVFAHILAPHPPYIFNRDGEQPSDTEFQMDGNVWEQKAAYIDQLIFINRKVEEMTDDIIKNSVIPPVIVIQADHGSASSWWKAGDEGWDENPSDEMLKERMRIFNAYYLPVGDNIITPATITPVNTFRLILNICFNTQFEILEDKAYFSIYSKPYDFIDVTEIVRIPDN